MITFAAEKRHKLMLGFGVLSGILGVMILAGGICAGAAGNIIAGTSLGPLVFAAGIITVKNTRGGKAWQGQSAKEKALAVPGLICGGFLGLLTIPAVPFTVMSWRCPPARIRTRQGNSRGGLDRRSILRMGRWPSHMGNAE